MTKKEYPESWIIAFMRFYKPIDIQREAGISRSKYYKLKDDKDFMRAVTVRRKDIIAEAVMKMESYLSQDVETLQGIIESDETSPQVKINAINTLMSQLSQWKDNTELLERIQALEDAQRRAETD